MAREFEMHDTVEPQQIGVGDFGMRQRREEAHDSDEEDEDGLKFIVQHAFTPDERKWAWVVVVTSCMDVVASAIIFCTSFKYAWLDGGVSLYSLGFQSVSHWISSVLLALRFISELRYGHTDDQSLLRDRRRTQLYREQGLSITMAIVMLISSCALLFKAFRKLKFWEEWEQDLNERQKMQVEVQLITEWLAWTGFSIYVIQGVLRSFAACKLKVGMMSHGMVASYVSLGFLFVLGLAASFEQEWSWKAEPIAAIFLVFVTLVEAIRIVYNYLDDMEARLKHYDRA